MSRIVLDSSFTLAWAFEDERSAERMNLLHDLMDAKCEAVTSPLWQFEVANALIVSERRARLSQAQSVKFLELLQSLPIHISESQSSETFSSVMDLARQHKLTAYDAAYLELAIRDGLALATLDDALQRAAKVAGTNLIEG